MITINQGRSSSNKPYFLVADPDIPRAKIGDDVLCVNPKTMEQTKGIVVTRWTFNWDKDPLAGLILLEYGVSAQVLRKGLEALDEVFKNPNCSLLLIREII